MKIPDELRSAIGAKIMVGVRGTEPGDEALQCDLAICEEARVGGVILFDVDATMQSQLVKRGMAWDEARGRATRNIISPEQTRKLVTYLKERLGENLIVAVDNEGGVTTRLSPAHGFAQTVDARSFAALDQKSQQEEARRLAQIACDCRVNLNLAPCMDLDCEGLSEVISGRRRSYSSDASTAVHCARTVIEAHRTMGVMTCVKHYPGHGSARQDSHVELSDITDRSSEDAELGVYRALIPLLDRSTWVMTGHLLDRRVDEEYPASLSRAHTAGVLRNELGYTGVVVTDSLDMGAIKNRFSIEEAVVAAVNAGADVLLDGVNAPGDERECPAMRMVEAVIGALKMGSLSDGEDGFYASARRIQQSQAGARAARMAD
jgi:beta-N-acetylhexosaminidase